jgi:hypothetical protein
MNPIGNRPARDRCGEIGSEPNGAGNGFKTDPRTQIDDLPRKRKRRFGGDRHGNFPKAAISNRGSKATEGLIESSGRSARLRSLASSMNNALAWMHAFDHSGFCMASIAGDLIFAASDVSKNQHHRDNLFMI